MTTTSDLVREASRYLMSGQREPINTLSGAITSSATTVVLTNDISGIVAGSYLSVDLEVMYVWTTTPASKTVTVRRAMLGSTAASHIDVSLVTVNPRFSDFAILQAINADLDNLSPELFAVAETTLTYNPATQGYDITSAPSGLLDVLRVRHDTPGPGKTWPEIHRFQLKRNQAVSAFASGFTLVLYEPGWPGLDIRVTYSYAFSHLATLTDDVAAVAGLTASMMDIPPLGAAMRLSGVREVMRNFTEAQSDPRRATEVPPNAQMAGATALQRLHDSRIKSEVEGLRRLYPYRRRV